MTAGSMTASSMQLRVCLWPNTEYIISYRLQRVQFVVSRLTIFAALTRTMDRSSLLAVFHVGKLSTQ